jgi:hypothetical protein
VRLGGLDIATTTGAAVLNEEGKFETQTFKANVKKSILDDAKRISAKREGEIARKFEDFIQCWLIDNRLDEVAIEEPISSNATRRKRVINTGADFAGQAIQYQEVAGTSQAAIFRIFGLEMVALAVCNRLNIPVRFISQGEWGKAFTGNGSPSGRKDRAVAQCRRMGIEISSVDSAEAVGVVWTLNAIINPYAQRRANDLFSNPKSISVQQYKAEAEKLFK